MSHRGNENAIDRLRDQHQEMGFLSPKDKSDRQRRIMNKFVHCYNLIREEWFPMPVEYPIYMTTEQAEIFGALNALYLECMKEIKDLEIKEQMLHEYTA